MSYQFMAPHPSRAGVDVPQSGYSPGYSVQGSSALEGDCKENEGLFEEQDPNVGIRISFSTPNTAQVQRQGPQETQSQAGATGEKKRNKLGYHRTSIACSHCRRRKIRCIASPEVQNRCVNCIRLKKECSFYPVDQQPGAESRARAPARQAAGSSVASTTSSPAVAAGSPGEMPSHHPHPPPVTGGSGISQGNKVQTAGEEYYPPEVKVPSNGMSSGQFGFGNQPSANWMTIEVNSASLAKGEDLGMSWQSYPAEAPMSTQFSPYAQSSSASAIWPSGNSEPGSHDDIAWSDFPPPGRSMSLGGESTGSHQQLQYLSMGHGQPFERRSSALSDIYTHSFAAPVASMASGSMAGIESQRPLVAGTVGSNAEAWNQPLLSQEQNPYPKHAVTFDGWQYDKLAGSQQVWLEEQRSQTTAGQAPSEAYYSA